MEEIIGHENIWAYFSQVIERGAISHAYCFVGPEQVGKKCLARKLAANLLSCAEEKLEVNPDFFFVTRLFEEKTEKTKKDITVAQMRDLRQVLSRHSFLGGYKVAIIEGAEDLNAEAANALLKTLEEPTEKTVIILLTNDETFLPETIRSRCQSIFFQPVAKDKIVAWLKSQGADLALAGISRGLPGQAKTWQADNEVYLAYSREVERFFSLWQKPFYQKLKLVEDLFGDKTDNVKARDHWQSILAIWQMLVRDGLLVSLGKTEWCVHPTARSLPLTEIGLVNLEKAVVAAKEQMQENIHPRLLIENLLLILP
ncbi:MAG TPA: AAA family ATPase [Patescibacteria group bacterium]|nr:AAA family ATPase [Patescibacteria group bacterium]